MSECLDEKEKTINYIHLLPRERMEKANPRHQLTAEEAIAAGIDTLIFVTGRNKRAIG